MLTLRTHAAVFIDACAPAVNGGSGMSPLSQMMGDCELLGHYERSAALAVWHGDLRGAVRALQR
jgi:hypothetical protein